MKKAESKNRLLPKKKKKILWFFFFGKANDGKGNKDSKMQAFGSGKFGVITGSIFGFYPAYKASRLVPVVALNQEEKAMSLS